MEKLVLLLNLGTPEKPEPKAVGKYLREFLMDRFVVDLPFLIRWILVHLLIVPRRKFLSAENYQQVWDSERGSPLQFLMNDLRDQMKIVDESQAVDYRVRMRYADDSEIPFAKKVDLVPLFPQYAESSFRTGVDDVLKEISTSQDVRVLKPYFQHPQFIQALADDISKVWNGELVLFTFHGLPVRHLKKTDFRAHGCSIEGKCCAKYSDSQSWCYRAQCLQTARVVAKKLGIENYRCSFQSRLGRDPWILPATEDVIKELGRAGGDLLVIAPSFSIDCLETLHEIKVELAEVFSETGGGELRYVDCLNDRWADRLKVILDDPESWMTRKEYEQFRDGRITLKQ